MTDLLLVEHGGPVSCRMEDRVGRALAGSKAVTASPDPHRAGHWLVKAGSKVGVLAVDVPGGPGVVLRVTPKVPVPRLFFMLGYSLDPKGWRNEEVDVGDETDVLSMMARVYERHLEAALRQGLLQGYLLTRSSATTVRGRILEGEQIRRRYGMAVPLEVAYDEFTVDTAENRLLRTAAERLLRLPGIDPMVRRRLLRHRARMAEVTVLRRGGQLPVWEPSRLNARYQPALRLAGSILGESSAEHRTGDLRINGFLFDMNRLFEDFVTVALREALRAEGLRSRLQDHHFLDSAAEIRMRPDLVAYGTDGVPCMVVDAKYKVGRPAGYPDADLYQMLAYCTALGLREGHLVYAKGSAPHRAHRVKGAGVTIHQHALDLDRTADGLLQEVRRLAARAVAPLTG